MKAKIILLPGDGIGPEIVNAARQVLDTVASKAGHEFTYAEHLIGGIAIDETGNPSPKRRSKGLRARMPSSLVRWVDRNGTIRKRACDPSRVSSACGSISVSSRTFAP